MGFKSKSSFIKNYLTPAQSAGIIQLEDTDNPQSPNQRYGLTEKGKQIFDKKKLKHPWHIEGEAVAVRKFFAANVEGIFN